ncbi:hypothetical protein [Planctomicrobium piriforme]|uniref:DUF4149 domain-containing protein n=1 Tax=Planctomicrobium piriforme TaxID=1576369 RepID=A0A1I3DKQ1_9PLAN|nr:hypothetical protein [Planctomicrobium piriforme]SFH87324.1 hypothetical protein SAMN05421753_103300 [Planctomicrobium piriforme]
MNISLGSALFLAGFGQLSVLVASAIVPSQLNWKSSLASLPLLMRQLFWIYGAYVVLSIVSLGVICLTQSGELATGTPLARAVCMYGAAFWGIRLSLQRFISVEPFLTTWWLRGGYHLLTVLFTCNTLVYLWAVFH